MRLWNLGYSDYQGDEIKALYNPKEVSSVKFFLNQRKGPVQFAVTAGLKTFSPDYRNRLLLRLPFALAGFGSVVIFYYLARDLFGEKIAFYSSIFFATNGFFIAFSRIVQYQSFVIFFGLLAVYLTKKYVNTGRPLPLVFASISFALSVLSHYDGIFFFPIIFGLVLTPLIYNLRSKQIKQTIQTSQTDLSAQPNRVSLIIKSNATLNHLVLPTFLFITLTGAFYIPFALNISQTTTTYWAGRISGDVSSKISSSRYLFSIYQPIYVLHIYTILGITGLCLTVIFAIYKLFPQVSSKLLVRVYKIEIFKAAYFYPSLSILLSILAWFLLPFIALEAVISIPGTHIYAYLIPLSLLMGFATFHIELLARGLPLVAKAQIVPKFTRFTSPTNLYNILFKATRLLFTATVWTLFIFLTLQSYFIFVDHTYEYPWENKRFLFWTLPKPTPIFHLSMFGFPYYRHWNEIDDYIRSGEKALYYTTNERVSIARFHIDLEKDGEKAGYYVYIRNPQTFTNEVTNKRISDWMTSNRPVAEFSNEGKVVSQIYLVNNPAR